VIKDIPFNYSGHDGAYLYCAQYCDNDVVIAGGSGTNSVQAVNKVTGEVSFTKLIGNINDLSPFTIFKKKMQQKEGCYVREIYPFVPYTQLEVFLLFPLCNLQNEEIFRMHLICWREIS